MPSSDCVCKGTAFSAFRNGLSQTMKGFCPRPCDARRRKQPEKTEPCRSVGQHYSHEKDSRIHVSRDVANILNIVIHHVLPLKMLNFPYKYRIFVDLLIFIDFLLEIVGCLITCCFPGWYVACWKLLDFSSEFLGLWILTTPPNGGVLVRLPQNGNGIVHSECHQFFNQTTY